MGLHTRNRLLMNAAYFKLGHMCVNMHEGPNWKDAYRNLLDVDHSQSHNL